MKMTFASFNFMPVEHYENFPVASFLLPRRLVPAVEAIYAFARSADDLADEGDARPAERLAALEAYEDRLASIARGEQQTEQMFARLSGVIAQYQLSLQPFYDLLSAFKQDVGTSRYRSYGELLDYCRRSANPVGLLMLSLYGKADARNVQESDAICSALQIINFLQDVAVDREKDRVYVPMEDLERYHVSVEQLDEAICDVHFREMMRFEVGRARLLMLEGAPLAKRLPGRIGWELRLVVQGGLRILEAIEQANYDIFRHRPQLGKMDWALLVWRAVRM